MYCSCTIFPRHHLFSAFYPKGMNHVHGSASDPCPSDPASPLIHCYIFKNISSHCLPSSHFLLSSPEFLLPLWRIIEVTHGAYWGAGGKVTLLDFKFFIQSHLSQWPKHLILGCWWIDFTIFGKKVSWPCTYFFLSLLHPTLIGQYWGTSACYYQPLKMLHWFVEHGFLVLNVSFSW